jgi:hypothetical protein
VDAIEEFFTRTAFACVIHEAIDTLDAEGQQLGCRVMDAVQKGERINVSEWADEDGVPYTTYYERFCRLIVALRDHVVASRDVKEYTRGRRMGGVDEAQSPVSAFLRVLRNQH